MRLRNELLARASAAAVLVSFTVFALGACGGSSTPAASASAPSAAVVLPARPLGWLGANARPLTERIAIESDGETHSPGGLVLADLAPGGPLAQAGARVDDVIVRIEDAWIPLEENPALDAIELVERQVSAGRAPIRLFVWRAQALTELAVAPIGPALEVGLPVEVERFRLAAGSARDHLLALRREDGGFGDASAQHELAVDALVGLALLGAGAQAEDAPEATSAALHALADRVDALVTAEGEPDALALSLALAFDSERIGPLSKEVRLRGAPVQIFTTAAPGADGAHPVVMTTMQFDASSQEEASALLESMGIDESKLSGEAVQGDAVLPDGIELPEGFELPEGAQFVVATPGGDAAGALQGTLQALAEGSAAKADLSALLAELDPGRVEALARLGSLAQRLLALRNEDGSFGAMEAPHEERLHTSALALLALGCAQGVGLELEKGALSPTCAWLRAEMQEGKVAAAVARGADRRLMASDAALVAWAFLTAGCPDTDPLVHALLDFSDEKGEYLLEAPRSIALGSLATAAVRRWRDLMSWQRFYDQFRIALVTWQTPDGGFDFPASAGAVGLDAMFEEPAAASAVGLLLLTMQDERLAVMLGRSPNPFAPQIDGHGDDPKAPKPADAAESSTSGTASEEEAKVEDADGASASEAASTEDHERDE
jgi:hypothetical protein